MSEILKSTASNVGLAVAFYGILRSLRFKSDAAKFLAVGITGWDANKEDLELLTPFLLAPTVRSLLRRSGSHHISQALCAMSMGYIILKWHHDHQVLPKQLNHFMDKIVGASKEELSEMRMECKTNGWITKKFTGSHTFPTRNAIKGLAVKVTAFQMLIMVLKMVKSRKWKVNPRYQLISWLRMIIFCNIVLISSCGWIRKYNQWIHHHNDSEEIKRYRPSKAFQMTMFTLCAYVGLQVQTKSKRRTLASCLILQAIITRLNQSDIRLKNFFPVMCLIFSQQNRRPKVPL